MKTKNVANGISILRILMSLSLLFVDLFSMGFITIYLLCGISDVLDGYIARRTKSQSVFGAKIDTTADIIMFVVMMYLFIPVFVLSKTLLIWLLSIFIIRIISIVIVYYKYRIFAMLHTISNKITGFLLFFIPIVIGSAFEDSGIYFVCIIASISAIEELAINILSSKMDVNVKSIIRV